MKDISLARLFTFHSFDLKKIGVCLSVFFFATTLAVYAYPVGNLEFKNTVRLGSAQLFLRGAGLKKFLSVRVFAAGLYLADNVDTKDVLKDIPKRLEVVYLQNIPDVELQRATIRGIRLNASEKEFKKLATRIEQLNAFYPSVQKMDRILVTYIPGKGTIVEVNGVVKGVIPGADFGKAFFAIWVGEKPVDPRMKQILLGKTKLRNVTVND